MEKKIYKNIHFIGIGGIGMSALAQWFLHEGWRVTGSDEADSPMIAHLQKNGIQVIIGAHGAKNISKKIDRVIYSQAVITIGKSTNPEIREAEKRGIPFQSYPEALGELMHKKYTIAICGTHGKSTTTGLTGVLLHNAGFDPTVIVGATVPEFGGSNFRYGDSRYLVIEADEYKGAFLHYHPDIVIWTTVEWEHIDYFKTFRETLSHFKRFLSSVPRKGYIIANKDDANIKKIMSSLTNTAHKRYYSLSEKRIALKIEKRMKLIGQHNVSNALAVYTLAQILGIPDYVFWKTLRHFKGVGRRTEYKGKFNGALLYDDYGHHPTEIKTTLEGIRKKYEKRLKKGKLWCVFQPHQYQRTKYLFNDFAKAFRSADSVLLLDVYSVRGREKTNIKKEVNSKQLAEAIRKNKTPAWYMQTLKKCTQFLKKNAGSHDVIVIMGAGDIWKIWEYFKT